MIIGSLVLLIIITQRTNPIFLNIFSKSNPNSALSLELEGESIKQIRVHSVTNFKASVMLTTVLAILIIDFPLLFERYLCKVEDHGWALMDVGVSAVMFSTGIANKLVVTHKTTKKANFLRELVQSVTGNVGVTIAATIRFFLLTGIEYHDHVTEWGVHWNFFLTIAVLNVLMVFLRSSKYAMEYGFILLIGCELLSMKHDASNYMFYAKRVSMVSANKEGILSLPGYLAIQLIGIGIGRDIY